MIAWKRMLYKGDCLRKGWKGIAKLNKHCWVIAEKVDKCIICALHCTNWMAWCLTLNELLFLKMAKRTFQSAQQQKMTPQFFWSSLCQLFHSWFLQFFIWKSSCKVLFQFFVCLIKSKQLVWPEHYFTPLAASSMVLRKQITRFKSQTYHLCQEETSSLDKPLLYFLSCLARVI